MKKLYLFVLLSGFIGWSANAQWVQTNGPYTTGTVSCFATNGTNLFAGTSESGVYLTTNFGSDWTPENNGYTVYAYNSMLLSGSDLWAAGVNGLYLSTNNGANWSFSLGGGFYSSSGIVTLGTTLIACSNGGIYRSTTNGTSWTNESATITNATLTVVGSDFLAATTAGIYLSTDNGVTWSSVNATLTSVVSLTTNGSSIYAGTSANGVYLSTNNGSTWATTNSGLTNLDVTSFAWNGTDLYCGTGGAGVFLSTNFGASWSAVNTGITTTYVYAIAILGANIFIGTDNTGVELSSNFGASWATSNNGFVTSDVRALTVFGSTDLFAGTNGDGAFLTSSNGSDWNSVNGGMGTPVVNCFLSSGLNLFAGTNGTGVYVTTTNGASWTAMNSGLVNMEVQSLVQIGSDIFAATLGGGVYLTTNNGTSWSAVNSGLSNLTVNSLTTIGSDLFAATDAGVFLSTNSGAGWSAVNTGLPVTTIYSVASSGTTLFAAVAGASGIYLSTNNGTSWANVTSGITGSIFQVAAAGGYLFALGYDINISINNGTTWNNISTGLPAIVHYGLAVNGNSIFLGSVGLGVFTRQLPEILCSINPPVMSSPSSATICSGSAVSIPLTNTGVTASYSWIAADNTMTTGESTSLQTTATLSNTLVNSSSITAASVVYTVTPTGTAGGCAGTPQTVTVTVDPTPLMTSNSAATICSGQAVGLALTSSVGASYSWIASANPNISGQSTSLQNSASISDVITNTSLVAQQVTYTVTPTSSVGTCTGTTQTLIVTVNPTPVMTSVSSATICSGGTVNIPLTSTVKSNYVWEAANNANTSGESTSFQSTGTLSNTIENNTAVAQQINYTITPTAVVGGCSSAQTFTLTVNPAPTMTSAASASICSGSAVSIPLTSNLASSYVWEASSANPNTSGESLSPQTTATINNAISNTTAIAQIVYYSVIPTSNTGGCQGATQSVAVTVNPVPAMISSSAASVCSGSQVSIPFEANLSSDFSWIATANANVTGESTSLQSGLTLSNVLTDRTTSSQTVLYSVVPTSTVLGNCTGTAQTVTVAVNPVPAMTSASSATVCSGSTVSISLTSTVPASYQWNAEDNVNVNGESLFTQSGSTLSNVLTNNSGAAQGVVYSVTPSAGTCQGATQTVTVTVNPAPVLISSDNATVCSGAGLNLSLLSTIPSTFSWVAASNPNVTGESITAQAGSALNDDLVNATATVQNVVYTVTATSEAGDCVGGGQEVSVLVYPLDNAGFSYSSGSFCQSGNDPSALITGLSGGIFSSQAGLFFLNSNNGLINLNGSTLGDYVITYKTAGACPNSSTFDLSITAAPTANFSYAASPYCSNASNPSPVFGGSSVAGIFSANPTGLSFVSTLTGEVNLSVSLPGTYTVTNFIAAAGGCASTYSTSDMTVNPLPAVSFSGLAASYYYNDTASTLSGVPSGGIFSGTGISGDLFNPAVAGPGTFPITYSYTSGNGCSNTTPGQSTTVIAQPFPPKICEVSVDDSSHYNVIYWDKTHYTMVDSFIFYRETGSGYMRIGAVSDTAIDEFTDTCSHTYFPNTGNPNAGTYRYKIQIRDSLGNYSPMSPFHNTIYINQTSGTFTWNAYEMEGLSVPLPGNILMSYDLWRDDLSNGNWHIVNSVSGSQLTQTDVGWSSSLELTASWRIETNWDVICTPTSMLKIRSANVINSSRSNIKNNFSVETGIAPLESIEVKVYPNPANSVLNVVLPNDGKVYNAELVNVLGERVSINQLQGSNARLDLSLLSSGLYYLKLTALTGLQQSTQKIVVTK